LGLLIGDGKLPHYGSEDILEAYYRAPLLGWLSAGMDYQFVANPAYNRDRGPVSVIGAQLHAQF
jgi:high affinity Mn2+ porin